MPAVLLSTCLAACALLGSVSHDGSAVAPRPTVRASSMDTVRTVLVEKLRASRKPGGPDHEDVVAAIQSLGTGALEPMLDLLVARQVPSLVAGEHVQSLSEPQREMLLAALATWAPRTTFDAIEARLARNAGAGERIAAIYIYGALGGAGQLDRVRSLALDPSLLEHPEELPKDVERAVRTAFCRILKRDASGYPWLRTQIERAPACLQEPIVFAIGDTHDPCGIEPLALVLAFHPELAPLVVAQVRLLGQSCDSEANRRLAREVRPYLASERIELACATARALGELGDDESVPEILALLESPQPALVQSAHWALRRISRLNLPALVGPWRASLSSEQLWWDKEAAAIFQQATHGIPPERLSAVAALGGRPWRRADVARELLPTLQDRDAAVRLRACASLGQLGSPVASATLADTLADPDRAVAEAALKALVAIHGRALPTSAAEARAALHL